MKVEIIQRQDVFQKAIFRIEETRLRHETFEGEMSREIIRLTLHRGDGVTAILHDENADTVVMVEQFRYPTYGVQNEGVAPDSGWLLELPAGIINPNEAPQATILREVREETGYDFEGMQHVYTFYLSPGGSSERIFLYYARVKPEYQRLPGGGVLAEDENLRVLVMPLAEVVQKIASGEIKDAKTIIGVQWLQLHKAGLK